MVSLCLIVGPMAKLTNKFNNHQNQKQKNYVVK